MRDPVDGRLLDFGTKGSGLTPYSRTADGRLTLKGAVREILATERLDALGVNTSKTFSVIETGEPLERHDEPSPTRSAVLVRLSHGHIRIGSFQRLVFQRETEALEELLRYAVATYHADVLDADAPFEELAPAFVGEVAFGWLIWQHHGWRPDLFMAFSTPIISISVARALIMAPGDSCHAWNPVSPPPILIIRGVMLMVASPKQPSGRCAVSPTGLLTGSG